MDFDSKELSSLLSKKLGKDLHVAKIEKIGSGYHSDGFKILCKDGAAYFIKKIKSSDLGFEIPERKVSSLLISNGMAIRSGLSPRPIGVMLSHKNETSILPPVDLDTKIYHIQEFEPDGESYFSRLEKRKEKKKVDAEDKRELEAVIDFIAKVHSIKYPSHDPERQKAVYNDGLRSILVHPELTVMFLHDFEPGHPLLAPDRQREYVGLMLDLIHRHKNRVERLCALHGDFWGANIFLRKDGSVWAIDYSRIPWGDPGFDIGWWISQYIWFYHETKNSYFKELNELFLALYEKKTGDTEVRNTASLVLGLMGVIWITPRFYPDLNLEIGERFFNNIWEILRQQKFVWIE